MWGVPVDLERMARSAARYRQQLVAQLDWITAMLADLRTLLEGAALNPEQRVSELCRLIPSDRRQALTENP